jgi:enoyl-CoA hydratase/carnithine racemase
MADEILYAVADSIATITLNRPERRNALNTAMMDALGRRFEALEGDASVRAVVIRGAGPAFCSGRDLEEMSRRQDDGLEPEADVIALFQQIEASRHPTIAMVHGAAYAGGCELALHCDFRVAADVARFAMPLAKLGLVVPFPLGQKLVEIIGPAFTRQILLTGQPVDAHRAYEMGMVHTVVPAAELEKAAYDLARTIAGNAPLSLAGMKATIRRSAGLRDRIEHADLDELAHHARASADAREGVRAMLEHRKPDFRGE